MSIFQPSAKVVAHSIYNNTEIITFVGTMHRFVLSEFNTHRTFARNSASSRAVPVSKMIALAQTANVEPLEWGQNRSGMSADTMLPDDSIKSSRKIWDQAREHAIQAASQLHIFGGHKQIVNRILEPFLPHTVIFTTEKKHLQHFFNLRISPNAQPEIREFAKQVKLAYESSEPELLYDDGIHLPFISPKPWALYRLLNARFDDNGNFAEYLYSQPIYDSVSMCARVSYLKHEEGKSADDNANLFWRLIKDGHLSPFEHIAIPYDGIPAQFVPKLGKFTQCYGASGFRTFRRLLEAGL